METLTLRYRLLALAGLLLAGVVQLQPDLPDWGRCTAMLLGMAGAYRFAAEPWSKTIWWGAVAFIGLGLGLSLLTPWL
jgi:hypothetical protein